MRFTSQIDSLKTDNQSLNQKILDIKAALNCSNENKENENIPNIIDEVVFNVTSQIDSLKANNQILNQKILDINTAVENPKKSEENDIIPNIIDDLVIKCSSQIDSLKADNQLLNQKILDISAAVKNPKESKEDEKCNQNKKTIKRRTKKKIVVEKDHSTTVRPLRNIKAGVDEADKSGGTSLHQAATNERSNFIRTQPDAGARVDNMDSYDRTSLTKAANNGHKVIVGILPPRRNDVIPLTLSAYNDLKSQTPPPNNVRLSIHDRLAFTDTFASASRKSICHSKVRRSNNSNCILPDYSFKISTPSTALNLNSSTSHLRTSSTKEMMRNSIRKNPNFMRSKTKWPDVFVRLSQTELHS